MYFHKYLTALACIALTVAVPARLLAAEDWWDDSPYYEEDAWYDVTEWFDGNDYHYVEQEDTDTSSYHGLDESYTYDYDYGSNQYGYGYDDRYDADDWFYDYWDDGYAYYRDLDDDGIYDYSYSYYDYDGDGVYDAYIRYHDWDNDGLFEGVDYRFFNQAAYNSGQDSESKKTAQRSQSSKSEMVRGEVLKTKKTTVRDTKHLIAKLEKSDGKQCTVDLGPANKLQELAIAEGDQISVRGPMTKVGDQRVLIAQELKVDGQSQGIKQIQRNGQKFKGKVADTHTAKVQGKKHSFMILASANDKKKLVDLGPANKLDVDPEKDDQISVTAVPVKANDRVVLMAQKVNCHGQECEIDRSESKSNKSQARDHQASSKRHSRAVTGKVQRTQEVTVRGNDRTVATIKTQNGDKLLVDLGPAGGFDEHLRNGDKITVRGPIVKSSDNKPVVLARSLERDGEEIDLGRRGTQHSDATQRTIRGDIESTRKVTVHGKQRQMAKIETDDGRSVVVDLGSPTLLDMELAEGDQLVASGPLVKAGDQVVLIAYEVEGQNGGMIAIDRRAKSSRDGR